MERCDENEKDSFNVICIGCGFCLFLWLIFFVCFVVFFLFLNIFMSDTQMVLYPEIFMPNVLIETDIPSLPSWGKT